MTEAINNGGPAYPTGIELGLSVLDVFFMAAVLVIALKYPDVKEPQFIAQEAKKLARAMLAERNG